MTSPPVRINAQNRALVAALRERLDLPVYWGNRNWMPLLPDVVAGRNVRLKRAIIDRRSRLPDGFSAGIDLAADSARGFHVSAAGVTLVTPEMIGGAQA